jgi:hypothetical protein
VQVLIISGSIKEQTDTGMPGAPRWTDDDDRHYGRSRVAAPAVESTVQDASLICEEIKKMYVDLGEQSWLHSVRSLYDPLRECIDVLYEDDRAWKLREQSDNYAGVMTRVKECLKKGYAACRTERAVYVNVPYDTYSRYVDICCMCGRYVEDMEMSRYVKATRERYTERQKNERPIFELEIQVADVTSWRDIYKKYYEAERDKREKLQEQVGGQNSGWRERRRDDLEAENTTRELQEEVVRLKTEIEDLKGKGAKEVTKLKTKIEVLKEEVVRLTTENDSLKKKSGGTSWNPFRGNRAHMQTLLEDLNNCRE